MQVLITPFAEEDHFIQTLFPPRGYAVLIPAYAGVLLCTMVAGFIGLVMLRSSKQASKQAWPRNTVYHVSGTTAHKELKTHQEFGYHGSEFEG